MLNEIQIALLPKGFHRSGVNRKRRRLAKKLKPVVDRVQVVADKETGTLKKIIHEKKKK